MGRDRRGVPTRIGRTMLAAFGTPIMLGAAGLLTIAAVGWWRHLLGRG